MFGHAELAAALMLAASSGTRITLGHWAWAEATANKAAITTNARERAPTEGINDMVFLL
jgi:hypothetical protein